MANYKGFDKNLTNIAVYEVADLFQPISDTIPLKKKKAISDSSLLKKDSTKTIIDTLIISKDSLDAPVKYSASDSGVLMVTSRQFILYGKSSVEQKNMSLDAGLIKYNQSNQTLLAYGNRDTSNNPLNKPRMKDGTNTSISDTIAFSLKSQKGRTVNTYYNEGELFVNAQVLKKVDKDVFYGWKGRFTTCNLDTPHFAFRTRKLKMITNKIAVSGPASPEFEGVPIPIGIPFGIYPLNRGRHSGVLAPQFITSEDLGIGLEGLGYYKVINDNWELTVKTNLYSYGGWSLNIAPRYIKRYRYVGNLNITMQQTKTLNRVGTTKNEFDDSKSFMINWTHNRDNKARPGTSFGANVNFGSTKFNQNVLTNPLITYNNQLQSSISYSKNFNGKANLSLNANHNQNNSTKLVNLNLPTATFSVVTFYPFQKKEKVGTPKWYENIGIGYSGNFTNQFAFYDTAFIFRKLLDTMQWSVTHNIPISLTLPQLGPITISPSVSYQEKWFGQRMIRTWNSPNNKVDTLIKKGFYAAREMSFGISANTRIFGTYNFKSTKIRHEIRPSISLNYKPDLASGYHRTLQIDSTGKSIRVSEFEAGGFSEGVFGGIGFGVDNLLEMKVKNKKDTAANATKKIKLIDGFGFNSSYNLLADSFKFSTFNLYVRSTLFEKINITANATLDPYQIDEKGVRKNHLLWYAKHPSLGRITGGSIAISTQFRSKSKDGKKVTDNNLPVDPFMSIDEQQRQLQYTRANPAEFTDFNIPWSLNLSYSLYFSRVLNANYNGFTTTTTSSTSFNGDFSLTPKWKMGGTGFWNFNNGKIEQLTVFITREMHCWQLSINVTPINISRSFSISISPKSGILRDLKINRVRTFTN